jgi:hypothetical protein
MLPGLKVAVDDPLAVQVVDRPGRLGDEPGQPPPPLRQGLDLGRPGRRGVRQSVVAEAVRQAPAHGQLHGEEELAGVLADVVNAHQVVVLQVGGQRQLAQGAAAVLRVDQLQGDDLVDVDLAGPVDDALAAAGDLAQQFVVAEEPPQAGGLGHGPQWGEERVHGPGVGQPLLHRRAGRRVVGQPGAQVGRLAPLQALQVGRQGVQRAAVQGGVVGGDRLHGGIILSGRLRPPGGPRGACAGRA